MAIANSEAEAAVAASAGAAARRAARRRLTLCLAVALGGVGLSVLISWLTWTWDRQYAETRFRLDAGRRVEALTRIVNDRLGALATVGAYFAGSQLVDRNEFRTFTQRLLEQQSGTRILAWAPRVPASRRKAHEQAARDDGLINYAIHNRDASGRVVAVGERDEYYPILFAELQAGNSALLGLDLGSIPEFRAAFRNAQATRRQAAFVGPPLAGHANKGQILYVVEAAWNEKAEPKKRPVEQPASDGFIVGAFYVGTIADASLDYLLPVGIDMFLSAPAAGGRMAPIYTMLSPCHAHVDGFDSPPAPPAARAEAMRLPTLIDVADTRWNVDCVPMDAYLDRLTTWRPLGSLLVGLVLTGLAVGYLVLLTGHTRRVEQRVVERTHELREMLDLHERERKLVAYDIHDGLSQLISGAYYKLQAYEQLRDRDAPAAREQFDQGVAVLREAIAEARRVIGGLRPPVLDELGVVAAVEYLVAERSQHKGPAVEFLHDAEFGRLAPPLESAIYRIVQECLTNAARHSQSDRVRIELTRIGRHVRVDVRDWGVGFNPEQARAGHFGLKGLRERAHLLGGEVTFQSAPHQGAHIIVELPVVLPPENGVPNGES